MVLAELWFTFLPQRGAVAGRLGLHSVFGQPGNYVVVSSLQPSFTSFEFKDSGALSCFYFLVYKRNKSWKMMYKLMH